MLAAAERRDLLVAGDRRDRDVAVRLANLDVARDDVDRERAPARSTRTSPDAVLIEPVLPTSRATMSPLALFILSEPSTTSNVRSPEAVFASTSPKRPSASTSRRARRHAHVGTVRATDAHADLGASAEPGEPAAVALRRLDDDLVVVAAVRASIVIASIASRVISSSRSASTSTVVVAPSTVSKETCPPPMPTRIATLLGVESRHSGPLAAHAAGRARAADGADAGRPAELAVDAAVVGLRQLGVPEEHRVEGESSFPRLAAGKALQPIAGTRARARLEAASERPNDPGVRGHAVAPGGDLDGRLQGLGQTQRDPGAQLFARGCGSTASSAT